MKTVGILAVLLLLLTVLLGVMVFKYEQLEKYDGVNRYIKIRALRAIYIHLLAIRK